MVTAVPAAAFVAGVVVTVPLTGGAMVMGYFVVAGTTEKFRLLVTCCAASSVATTVAE